MAIEQLDKLLVRSDSLGGNPVESPLLPEIFCMRAAETPGEDSWEFRKALAANSRDIKHLYGAPCKEIAPAG